MSKDYFYDQTLSVMIEISTNTYRELATLLRNAISDSDYFNGAIEYECEQFYARLVATVIVYRAREVAPEGVSRPIADVVPVWWEMVTTGEGGEEWNDFSFEEIRPMIKEVQ